MSEVAIVEKRYETITILGKMWITYKCKLWKSRKGNWLLTHETGHTKVMSEAIGEEEAKSLLLKHDIAAYERIYEPIDEA